MITTDKKTLKTDKERICRKISDAECNDRYGFGCGTFKKAMLEFEEEEQMADQIFKIY